LQELRPFLALRCAVAAAARQPCISSSARAWRSCLTHRTTRQPAPPRSACRALSAQRARPCRGALNLRARAQESQRLLSVLPILFRQARADVRIGGLLVPRGTFCIVHLVRRAPPAVLGAQITHGC